MRGSCWACVRWSFSLASWIYLCAHYSHRVEWFELYVDLLLPTFIHMLTYITLFVAQKLPLLFLRTELYLVSFNIARLFFPLLLKSVWIGWSLYGLVEVLKKRPVIPARIFYQELRLQILVNQKRFYSSTFWLFFFFLCCDVSVPLYWQLRHYPVFSVPDIRCNWWKMKGSSMDWEKECIFWSDHPS